MLKCTLNPPFLAIFGNLHLVGHAIGFEANGIDSNIIDHDQSLQLNWRGLTLSRFMNYQV